MSTNRRCPICTLYHRQGHKALCRAVPATHRWPFAPVAALLPDELHAQAGALAADWRSVELWQTEGLDDRNADRVATHLGLHPTQLWGWAWIDAALTPLDRQRLDGGWRNAWLHDNEGHAA